MDKNFDEQLSRIALFKELRKYVTYKKSVRFGNIIVPAFIGLTLK